MVESNDTDANPPEAEDVEQEVSDEELEEKYSDEPREQFVLRLNGKLFDLNEDMRKSIQDRAASAYRENWSFECFWKNAAPTQYEDGEWENNVHDEGDPILVIETEGPMVPWDKLDQLDVQMQEPEPDSGFDGTGQGQDSGADMQMVSPRDMDDDDEKELDTGRTHFAVTPQEYEEVPDPDGEQPDKIPAKPDQMGDDPAMVGWVPDNPNVEHTWSTGEAIVPMYSRVEWNVQKRADQPKPQMDGGNSHDSWESTLGIFDCEVLDKDLEPVEEESDDSTSVDESKDSGSAQRKGDEFEKGKFGGNNWAV